MDRITRESSTARGRNDVRPPSGLSRRAFVKRVAGTALVTTIGLGLPLLAACAPAPAAPSTVGPSAPTLVPTVAPSAGALRGPAATAAPAPAASVSGAAPAKTGRAALLPSYIPVTGPTPDLPGSPDGMIEPGYFTYPKQLFKSVPDTPARGGEVNLMTFTTQPPAAEMDQNPAWQAINKDVGATLRMNAVPFADYNTKFATVITGNDLPDIFYVLGSGSSIQNFPRFLETRCADLTPYLSGDAIKEYPNLANLPTMAWNVTIYSNKIYGVPIPYVPFNVATYVQQGMLDQAGVGYPKNADEFKLLLQALTQPQQNVYGIGAENNLAGGAQGGSLGYPLAMLFRAPNNWKVDRNGKFTRVWETDEYRQAISFAAGLYGAGVYTPSTPTLNNVSAKAEFAIRKFAVRYDGWQPSSLQYWNTGLTLTPPATIRLLPPFSHDGGAPVFYLSSMARSFSMVKQASPERVKEMLRILNWFAAPFGSTEYELQYYGIKGVDFTLDDRGNPSLTDKGKLDVAVPWQWITQGPLFDFNPLSAEYAKVMQAGARAYLPVGITDPSIGLYSATNQAKGGAIGQVVMDAMNDLFFGRRPLADFDQIVKAWRSEGGDLIRGEYEEAYAAAKA